MLNFSIKITEELDSIIELGHLKQDFKKVHLSGKLAKEDFDHDIEEFFEPILKTIESMVEKNLKGVNLATKELRN